MSSTVNVLVLTEDTYSPPFLDKVTVLLKNQHYIPACVNVYPKKCGSKPCDPSIERKILLYLTTPPGKRVYHHVVLFYDGEGKRDIVEARLWEHVPPRFKKKNKVSVVVNDFEIEEWICACKGIKCYSKPHDELDLYLQRREGRRYLKRHLPRFAGELDVDVLLEKSRSFRAFC